MKYFYPESLGTRTTRTSEVSVLSGVRLAHSVIIVMQLASMLHMLLPLVVLLLALTIPAGWTMYERRRCGKPPCRFWRLWFRLQWFRWQFNGNLRCFIHAGTPAFDLDGACSVDSAVDIDRTPLLSPILSCPFPHVFFFLFCCWETTWDTGVFTIKTSDYTKICGTRKKICTPLFFLNGETIGS